jgi:signal transduction histidine kinase
MNRQASTKDQLNPLKLVMLTGLSIFVMELLVMIALEVAPDKIKVALPEVAWTIIDPVMLAVLVSPLLYVLLLKPLRGQQSELLLRQQELNEMNATLERRVHERTAKLLTMQEDLKRDISLRKKLESALLAKNSTLEEINRQLNDAQNQLLQSDKMASVGQLAAGVAHEINNPIGFVFSNLGSLERYLDDLFELLTAYETAEASMSDTALREVEDMKRVKDLKYLREDIPVLLKESRSGLDRVKKIVQDLKNFSHVDSSDEWKFSNLHDGLNSTLNIVANEIKYHAEVKKDFGEIPEIECLPSQLNQVFMNLLVNAAHAIEGKGVISIQTGKRDEGVFVRISDTGKGIPQENLKRIFDPFFTTKPVGKGTGLGLSLSYGIIQKHHGRIEVESEVGKGTTFTVWLPITQDAAKV